MTSPLIVPGTAAPAHLVTGAARPLALLSDRGDPQPPGDIVERLKRLNPLFGLRFANGLSGSGWAVTRDWPEHDRRRQWIRESKYDPESAYDTIGSLPFGCTVDQAASYVERAFRDYPIEEVRKYAAEMHRWNTVAIPAEQHAQAVAATVEQTMADKRQQNPRRKRHQIPKRA